MVSVRKTLQLLLGLGISALALGLAFYNADLTKMAAAFQAARYEYLPLGAALIWVGLYCRALSWWIILEKRAPYRRVFDVMNEGYLLNNVLPFRLGELGRAYLLSRSHPQFSVARVLSSVVVERVVDLLMLIILLGAFLPLVAGLPWARDAAVGALSLGLVALAGLGVMVHRRAWVLRVAQAVLSRLRWAWAHPSLWEQRIAGFLDGLAILQAPRLAIQSAFWSGLAWLLAGMGTWALLLAFIPTATFTMGFFVLAVVGLGIAAPSAPGATGLFEGAVVLALSAFSIDPSVALSCGLTFHAVHIGVTSLLGSLALAREGETLGHLAQAAQNVLRAEQPASTPTSSS